jgi:pyruvate kinase
MSNTINTKIVATLGPVSESLEMLTYFKANNVAIARINCSHDTPENQSRKGVLAREAGLQILLDMPGPKIRMGGLESVHIKNGDNLILETEDDSTDYPKLVEEGIYKMVLPTRLDLSGFVKSGDDVLIDDGKVHLVVDKVHDSKIYCTAVNNGFVKSGKGINLPVSDIKIDFLTERDRYMMAGCLPNIKPEYVACSFVKTAHDVVRMRGLIAEILAENDITGYTPKICVKLEMGMALEDKNLTEIMDNCDMVMVARGDLALEAKPLHLAVPFLQDKIVAVAKSKNIPVIVATQMLESMISCPVPTRSEVSDVYRAVMHNRADYIMLSAESASGEYPKEAVKLMGDMISYCQSESM